jgi:hypothetical protein
LIYSSYPHIFTRPVRRYLCTHNLVHSSLRTYLILSKHYPFSTFTHPRSNTHNTNTNTNTNTLNNNHHHHHHHRNHPSHLPSPQPTKPSFPNPTHHKATVLRHLYRASRDYLDPLELGPSTSCEFSHSDMHTHLAQSLIQDPEEEAKINPLSSSPSYRLCAVKHRQENHHGQVSSTTSTSRSDAVSAEGPPQWR